MAYEVLMPQLGLTMEEGTVSQWIKHEGDAVKAGDVVVEITTDKLTNEITSEQDGVLLKIVAQEGADVPVKGLLGYIGRPGEQVGVPTAAAAPAAPAVEAAAAPNGPGTVLVIGGGGTGLAAAMSAMDNGAKDVMVVEKLSRFGGSTSVSGAVVAAENTYYTQSIGLEPNSEVWLEEWKASSDSDIGVLGKDPGYPTYERVSNYFTQVGETVNWLEDEGVAHWVTYPFFPNGRYQVPDYVIDSETGAADPEGGYMLIDHMVDWLKNHDADLRLSTTGTKLLTNDAGDVIEVGGQAVLGRQTK